MVREIMVGAGLAPAPLAFLGLQVPILLGIPSLCPAELSLSKWIKPSPSGFTPRGRIRREGDYLKLFKPRKAVTAWICSLAIANRQ